MACCDGSRSQKWQLIGISYVGVKRYLGCIYWDDFFINCVPVKLCCLYCKCVQYEREVHSCKAYFTFYCYHCCIQRCMFFVQNVFSEDYVPHSDIYIVVVTSQLCFTLYCFFDARIFKPTILFFVQCSWPHVSYCLWWSSNVLLGFCLVFVLDVYDSTVCGLFICNLLLVVVCFCFCPRDVSMGNDFNGKWSVFCDWCGFVKWFCNATKF